MPKSSKTSKPPAKRSATSGPKAPTASTPAPAKASSASTPPSPPSLPPINPLRPVRINLGALTAVLDHDPERFSNGVQRNVLPVGVIKVVDGADAVIGAVAPTTDGGVQIQVGKRMYWVSYRDLYRAVDAATKPKPASIADALPPGLTLRPKNP